MTNDLQLLESLLDQARKEINEAIRQETLKTESSLVDEFLPDDEEVLLSE